MRHLAPTDGRADDGPAGSGRRPPGRLQRIDPRVRIGVAVLFAIVTVGLADLRLLAAALLVATLFAGFARLPAVPTLRRLLVLDGFMVPILLLLPFSVPGEPIASLGAWSLSAAGVEQAVAIVLTANAIVLALLALVGTIEPVLLGHALAGLGLPEKLTRLLLLTTRYIGVPLAELTRLRLAMKARAFRPRGNLHTWRTYGYLFGMLLVRSFERSERILEAMKCRGDTGRLLRPAAPPLARTDLVFAGLLVPLLIGLGLADVVR